MVLLPMTIARAIAVTVAAMPSIRFDEVSLGGFAGLALSPPSVTRAMQEAFQFRIGWLPWAICLFMYKPMSRFVASVNPPIVCGIWTQRNPSGTSSNCAADFAPPHLSRQTSCTSNIRDAHLTLSKTSATLISAPSLVSRNPRRTQSDRGALVLLSRSAIRSFGSQKKSSTFHCSSSESGGNTSDTAAMSVVQARSIPATQVLPASFHLEISNSTSYARQLRRSSPPPPSHHSRISMIGVPVDTTGTFRFSRTKSTYFSGRLHASFISASMDESARKPPLSSWLGLAATRACLLYTSPSP